jgi:hypothetical protein
MILIMRSRSDPQARSEIFVIDRVSPGFLKHLTTDLPQRAPGVPPSEGAGDRRSCPPATRPQVPPRADASAILLDRTTDASPSYLAPSSDWRPRWLESGYQGS